MKKFLYITAVLATVALTSVSCKNEVDDLFDQSAAERAQSAVDEYTAVLTANGGKWVMEYFTTSKEPGYIYVFTFNADGSVVISGKNKWIGDVYKSEKSLWAMLSDNGPVLSLNSYNKVFHVFASPEDIPNESTEDPNETGYGHSGDYEFIFMEYTADVVRLKGKKYGASIYLRRLPADTDDKAYLGLIDDMKAKLFSTKFSKLYITNAQNERFVMTGGVKGVASFYPEAGDAVTQTSNGNFIVTVDGIRFMNTVEVDHADPTAEPFRFNKFNYQEADGSLICADDNSSIITAAPFSELFADKNNTWSLTKAKITGNMLKLYNDVVSECKKKLKETFRYFQLFYSNDDQRFGLRFKSGDFYGIIFYNLNITADNKATFTIDGSCAEGTEYYYNKLTSFKAFCDALQSTTWTVESDSRLVPSSIKFVSDNSADDSFTADL